MCKKTTDQKKAAKRPWFWKLFGVFSAVAIVVIVMCIVFLLIPSSLSICPQLRDRLAVFMAGLEKEPYKGEFIGAVGGLFGAFLAVIGSVWLQQYGELLQRNAHIKKCVTIIYFDFDFFYKESAAFIQLVYGLCKKHKWINEKGKLCDCLPEDGRKTLRECLNNDEQLLQLYRTRHSIAINPEWITNVAELSAAYTADTIHQIYFYYGCISELIVLMNNRSTAMMTVNELTHIVKQATQLGKFCDDCTYERNEGMTELLRLLKIRM